MNSLLALPVMLPPKKINQVRGYKTYFILKSNEHDTYHAHKCLKTFISMINTVSEVFKARKVLFFSMLTFMRS